MIKKEVYQSKILISALITFIGVALFILSILDYWNLAFLIPGTILFSAGLILGIIYTHKIKNSKSTFGIKSYVWILKKLKLKKLIELRLKLLEKNHARKKKKLKEIIKKL